MYIDENTDRIIAEAEYVIATGATVRATAKVYGVGKSTVHSDLTKKLYHVDKNLYVRVKKVLKKNLAERHLRGGEATKRKYSNIKQRLHNEN